MSLSARLQNVVQTAKAAFAQHPIELVFITIFSLPLWWIDLFSGMYLEGLAYWIFAPIFFFAIYLTHHTRYYKFSWLIPVLGSALLWYFNDNAKYYLENPKYWALCWVTLIVLCSVPFQRDNQPYMYHKFTTALNLILAFLTELLIFVILFAIVKSTEILFSIDYSSVFKERLWSFSIYFFTPLFFLIYQQRKADDSMELNRLFNILLHYIAAPALMIFTALLYGYVVKILLAGELPKGMVSNIVLPYVVAGLAIYCLRILSAVPRWNSFFRYYPYLAIVPFILLWLAIERRITDYAWTEARLYLVALATALSFCYVVIMLPKIRQYRNLAIIVIAAIVAMTYLIDPKIIARESQSARFEVLAEKMGLLDENKKVRQYFERSKIANKPSETEIKNYLELSNIANYLSHAKTPDEQDFLVKQFGKNATSLTYLSRYHFENDAEQIATKETRVSFNHRNDVVGYDISQYKRMLKWQRGFLSNEYEDLEGKTEKSYESSNYCLPKEEKGEQSNFQCWDFDQVIRDIFKANNLDVKQQQTWESLQKLENQFFAIQDPKTGNLTIVDKFEIIFHKKQGYIFSSAEGITLLMQ